MSDPAAFREEDIRAVWRGEPWCIVTGLRSDVDKTHILGRGGKYERKTYSSVFNMAPLIRSVHAGPARDTTDFRVFLLNRVHAEVMQAVGNGRYTLTDTDRQFLDIMRQFLSSK